MPRTTRPTADATRRPPARARSGALAGLVAAAVYGRLVPSGPHPTGWERAVAGWTRVPPGSVASRLASIVLQLGAPLTVAALAAGMVAGLVASGRARTAAAAVVSVLCGSAAAELAKPFVGRRIGLHAALAYPSGHTAGAAAAVTTMVLVIAPGAVPSWARRLAAAAPLMVGGAVGLAMMAKGFHYPADVVGGLVFGTCVPVALLGWPVVSAPGPHPAAEGDRLRVEEAGPGDGGPEEREESVGRPLPEPALTARRPVSANRRFGVREEPVADEAAAQDQPARDRPARDQPARDQPVGTGGPNAAS